MVTLASAIQEHISGIPSVNSSMNRRVYEVLSSVRKIGEENTQQSNRLYKRPSLDEIFQTIGELKFFQVVKKQADVIIRSCQVKIKLKHLRLKTHDLRKLLLLFTNI